MGLWDDSTEESGIVENQYIIDPSSGLNLICEILPKNMQKKTDKIDNMLDKQLVILRMPILIYLAWKKDYKNCPTKL